MKKNREGFLVGEIERECTNCRFLFKKTSKTVTLCNTCNSNRVKSTHPKKKMWQRAKNRARANGLDFNISVEDFEIPEVCPIMNIPLVIHSGKSGGRPDSPALDRVDNSKGYVKGNVVVISHLANMMKSCASVKELQIFAKWVMSRFPEEE